MSRRPPERKPFVRKLNPWEIAHRDCPDRDKHTTGPVDYIAASNWADEMMLTHVQSECPSCGFYLIWTAKPTPTTEATDG